MFNNIQHTTSQSLEDHFIQSFLQLIDMSSTSKKNKSKKRKHNQDKESVLAPTLKPTNKDGDPLLNCVLQNFRNTGLYLRLTKVNDMYRFEIETQAEEDSMHSTLGFKMTESQAVKMLEKVVECKFPPQVGQLDFHAGLDVDTKQQVSFGLWNKEGLWSDDDESNNNANAVESDYSLRAWTFRLQVGDNESYSEIGKPEDEGTFITNFRQFQIECSDCFVD